MKCVFTTDNNITTMITVTSTTSTTITIIPATNAAVDSSSEGLSTMIIIIIAVIVGGAIVLLLVTISCCLCCVAYRRRKRGKTTISTSTKSMMDKNSNTLNPVFKKVSPDDHEMVVMKNPSCTEHSELDEKEHNFGTKKDTPLAECLYEDVEKKPGQESNENYYVQDNRHVDNANQTYEIEQYNDRANQTYEIDRLATPDDYNNEALYEEMTARYYDINQTRLNEVSRSKVTLLEQLGKGEFGRVVKGLASDIIPGGSRTLVAVKLLKGQP